MHDHGITAAGIAIALTIGMIEIEHATLGDHGVVIDILFKPFPELQ